MALLLAAGRGIAASGNEHPKKVGLESPRDGGPAGRRPKFVVRVIGGNLDTLRFKIVLTKDDGPTIAYTFDEARDTRGWAIDELQDKTPVVEYYAREGVADGEYQWSVASWDGHSWKEWPERRRVRIDSVPPANVAGIQTTRDDKTGCMRIAWQSVTQDRDGRRENVVLYHVYRDAADGPAQPIQQVQVGETPAVEFEDCDAAAIGKPVLSYRVIAQDEAGNLSGRKF